MEFLKLIVEEGYVMVPALWIIGYVIKNTNLIDNRFIPLMLLAISLVITPWLLGGYTAVNVVQSILVAGGAVLGDQLGKQHGMSDYINHSELDEEFINKEEK